MSAAVDRALRILSFLGAHSGQLFSLSELCRRLEISKSTGHAALNQLIDSGFVSAVHNSYVIGPALVPLGFAAQQEFPGAAAAQREIEQLADHLDVEAIVSVATQKDSLIVFRAGIPRPLGITVELGQRLPIVPPMGSAFIAWSSEEEVEAWLDRLGPKATAEQRSHYREMLRAVRVRGYAVGYLVNAFERLTDLYTSGPYEFQTRAAQADLSIILADLGEQDYLAGDEREQARLANVSAPVFNSSGAVHCVITVTPNARHTSNDIPALADAVMKAADHVMREINGRRPDVTYLPSE